MDPYHLGKEGKQFADTDHGSATSRPARSARSIRPPSTTTSSYTSAEVVPCQWLEVCPFAFPCRSSVRQALRHHVCGGRIPILRCPRLLALNDTRIRKCLAKKTTTCTSEDSGPLDDQAIGWILPLRTRTETSTMNPWSRVMYLLLALLLIHASQAYRYREACAADYTPACCTRQPPSPCCFPLPQTPSSRGDSVKTHFRASCVQEWTCNRSIAWASPFERELVETSSPSKANLVHYGVRADRQAWGWGDTPCIRRYTSLSHISAPRHWSLGAKIVEADA